MPSLRDSCQEHLTLQPKELAAFSILELQIRIHISTDTTNCEIPLQAHHSDISNSFLAGEALVHDLDATQPRRPITSSCDSGLTLPRSIPSSGPGETTLDGMEVERNRLLEQGFSQEVVSTLLQARKGTTNTTYRRIWERFTSMAQQRNWNPLSPDFRISPSRLG